MKKDIRYYMGLPYRIEIVPIGEADGGGFMAKLPQFGVQGIVGDGDTVREALEDLEANKKERFERYLAEGLSIPEPESESEDYSGRFVLRMPKFLHRDLSRAAKVNGISLNHYVTTLLSLNFENDRLTSIISGIQEDIQSLNQCIGALKYRLDTRRRIHGAELKKTFADEYQKAA